MTMVVRKIITSDLWSWVGVLTKNFTLYFIAPLKCLFFVHVAHKANIEKGGNMVYAVVVGLVAWKASCIPNLNDMVTLTYVCTYIYAPISVEKFRYPYIFFVLNDCFRAHFRSTVSSVSNFSAAFALRELKFCILVRWYLGLNSWPRSPEIWPWPGPLPRKIHFSKCNL
jgi:phosphotransferase system  glucose/maltose/N-acetylglucosamine-specific IIC component